MIRYRGTLSASLYPSSSFFAQVLNSSFRRSEASSNALRNTSDNEFEESVAAFRISERTVMFRPFVPSRAEQLQTDLSSPWRPLNTLGGCHADERRKSEAIGTMPGQLWG